uniref:Myosin tail domain-containing protein n=1 Tax=Branchiostoma floridae TaxID=7739 RepID=C3XTN0_BRAFL|eukprot:XP_002612647.1 hypothetical protein BRAFLDRAFT_78721 [Branchiostoma floridae]
MERGNYLVVILLVMLGFITDDVAGLNEAVAEGAKTISELEKANKRLELEKEELKAALEEAEVEKGKVIRLNWELKAALEEAKISLEVEEGKVLRLNLELSQLKKANKRLEVEKEELQAALEEAESSLEVEEDKVLRLNLELSQLKKANKEELQAALEEAESSLEVEEDKVLRLNLELSQLKADIDRRLAEKEEEFEVTRKGHWRAIDSIQASLEAEAKAKAEALRTKKKLERDVIKLEVQLDRANWANSGVIGKLQDQVRDMQIVIDEEQRMRGEFREILTVTERRAQAFAHEMQETKAHWEALESSRGRKRPGSGSCCRSFLRPLADLSPLVLPSDWFWRTPYIGVQMPCLTIIERPKLDLSHH